MQESYEAEVMIQPPSLLPFTFSSEVHLGSVAFGVIGGACAWREQIEPRTVHLFWEPRDALPWKGIDVTQYTWLVDAAQVASWCQFIDR